MGLPEGAQKSGPPLAAFAQFSVPLNILGGYRHPDAPQLDADLRG
jgi:hypothetical protein